MTVALSGFVRSAFIACLALVGLLAPDASAAANPKLTAEQDGIDDAPKRRTLRLDRLDIAVTIEGSVAETTLTADFAGLPNAVLEGIFSLALPEGAVVHGYALDVNDAMIEGVPVARPKARAVYESKVRDGIDPGVAELSSPNVFTTKVFPIREEDGRTIRVTFSAPVHRGLTLPLSTDDAIGSVAITLRAREVAAAPKFELPAGLKASWQRTRDGFSAAVSASDVRLQGALVLPATAPRRSVVVSTHRSGQRFFQLRDVERAPARGAVHPVRVRVYWDTSLSRRDDRLADEIELLERYVREASAERLDLVTFSSCGARHVPIDSPEQLRRTLEEIVYRGATSFAVLNEVSLPDADVCLLFSDGNATLDRRDTFRPDCNVKAIASAADADRGYLSQLTREAGGVIVRLGLESVEHALDRLAHEAPIIVGATTVEGKPLSFTIVENDAKGWFVIGEAPRNGDVVLRFKSRYGRTIEQRYDAPSPRVARFDGAAALWTADRVAALNAADADIHEIERLSRRYSVAGPSFAYVVLEDPADYVFASVVPPKSYPQDAWAQYEQEKSEYDAELAAARVAHLEQLRDAWRAQKEWWQADFDPRAKPSQWRPRRADRSAGGDLEEIIVTGAYVSREAPHAIAVALEPWEAARPYIDALESAASDDLWRVIAQEERIHGQLPAFYLDTAEWLYLHDLVPEASEMLLSALDLPSSNDETVSIVADRLLRYGYFDRAIWLYERAARLANHRPQPLLQLALALAKRAEVRSHGARADLQRAIALLNEVATNPWDGAYEGIGLVALMEANALIPRLRRLGGSRIALAPDLIALLDLDIRVVIAWNTAATDLDLWVDEPNGERAIYSNRDTAIGGRLSEDMMSGYGPEEYLLRRAAPGEYRIHVDVYATDPINPNGATTVTARLIHDFGRPNEREASVDIELMPDETGERLVGRILVGGAE